jgi:hypothetical protein
MLAKIFDRDNTAEVATGHLSDEDYSFLKQVLLFLHMFSVLFEVQEVRKVICIYVCSKSLVIWLKYVK